MTNKTESRKSGGKMEVRKPFVTGSVRDERFIRNGLAFFGTLIVVFFIAFIACASATFSSFFLRLLMNSAVIIMALVIFFNSGSKRGAEDVTRGEIIWQKKEKGQSFTENEKKLCFHPLKGYTIGLAGSVLFIALAVFLAFSAKIQMTESGTLPSWMQAYTRRSDIGNALINYTQPEGMQFLDAVRAIVRITILPFVNIIGSSNKTGILLAERLSPVILMLPAAAYGFGYQGGKKIRTQIHTAISENDRRRIRKEKKKRAAAKASAQRREPEKLN